MFGIEDLLPAATRNYIKCEKPTRQGLIEWNDRVQLPYCLREGTTKKRSVHDYWRSDSMWDVMRDQVYLQAAKEGNLKREYIGESKSKVGKGIFAYANRRREGYESSDDESLEWADEPRRESRHKENAHPNLTPRSSESRKADAIAGLKTGPWMSIDAASVQGSTPASEKVPALSMTPRSVSRQLRDMTPRGFTPRSSSTRDATPRSATPRLRPSPSAPSLPPRKDASSQVTPGAAATPRGDYTPRSVTPLGSAPNGGGGSSGIATPRGMTPRGSAASLSMEAQLVVRNPRNGGTPRSSTPGAASRGLRKCASEVCIPRNS